MSDTDVAQAYRDSIERFLGHKDLPLRFIEAKKQGLLQRLFGSR
jgi:septum site-determining protein MinD